MRHPTLPKPRCQLPQRPCGRGVLPDLSLRLSTFAWSQHADRHACSRVAASASMALTVPEIPSRGSPKRTCARGHGSQSPKRLVAFLTGDFAGLVHFAIGALMDDLGRALPQPQNPVRNHPGLEEDVRIFDRHLVQNFI